MQDKELYQQILGLSSPWSVGGVELDLEAQEVRVHVDHPRGAKFCCPECGIELACHDHAPERRWRHLDSCQFKTVLVAKTPRVRCPEHGVKNATVPWSERGSRFTLLFERFAIDVLLATQTVKGAQVVLRTTWDETWHILTKAVARGQARKSDKAMPPPRARRSSNFPKRSRARQGESGSGLRRFSVRCGGSLSKTTVTNPRDVG